MSSPKPELLTRIYVLRCWIEPQQQADAVPEWRFRLEDVQNEQGVGFATLEELLAFLQKTFVPSPK